jgi:hypothetical protein
VRAAKAAASDNADPDDRTPPLERFCMNPRELLARLNVPAVRYEIGRGGIPDLTNIDVAGALGFIEDKFARDVFSSIWWPDGRADNVELHQEVLHRIIREGHRRDTALIAARMELHIAEGALEGKRFKTAFDERIIQDCKIAIDRARNQSWWWSPKVYSRLFGCAVREIRDPRHCMICHGRGETQREALKVICAACIGTGVRDRKKKDRAQLLAVDETSYLRAWCKVYDWSFRMIREAETIGAIAFGRAVASHEPEPA